MWELFWRRVVLSWSLLSALWWENLILGEHAIRVFDSPDDFVIGMTLYHDGNKQPFATAMFASSEPDDPMYGYVDVLVDDNGRIYRPLRYKRLYGIVHWNYGGEKP